MQYFNTRATILVSYPAILKVPFFDELMPQTVKRAPRTVDIPLYISDFQTLCQGNLFDDSYGPTGFNKRRPSIISYDIKLAQTGMILIFQV